MSEQNYAVVWLMFLGSLVDNDYLKLDHQNPKVFLLDSIASSFFLYGRDEDDVPFIGVPQNSMPFFTEVDWVEVSICREMGYLFLESRDSSTYMLNFVLGLKLRPERLNIYCLKGKEKPSEMRCNIRVFEQNKDDHDDVIFSDQNELVGLTVKEVDSTLDIGSELEQEEARSILAQSGIKGSFTNIKLTS